MPTLGRQGKAMARAVLVAAVLTAAPQDVRAQDRTSAQARDWQLQSAQSIRVREERHSQLERERAHARMPSTMYASTPDPAPPHAFPLASPSTSTTERMREASPAPLGASVARAHRIALFPAAGRWTEGGYQGLARIVNHSDVAGEVRIEAVDDAGTRHGSLTLAIGAGESVQLTSADLEQGNAANGLDGATGAGEGDWRLEFTSELDIEVLAYIRTGDGFLTAVHDRVALGAPGHRVPFFNPGGNVSQVSRLRLVNPGAHTAEVRIEAIDDTGASAPGSVRLEVPAETARTLSAHDLESGGAGLSGALGTGVGKWRLVVSSPQALEVMSLVSSPTGHLANVSTSPARAELDGDAFVHEVALLPSAARRLRDGLQGFVRVINHSARAGTMRIDALDDDGTMSTPLTLAIGANAAVHLTSEDLEHGNPDKGLAEGIGSGAGDWRVRLRSHLELEVGAYIQNDDGFLASVHDRVALSGAEHRVAMFNPGSRSDHVSRLRLVNPGPRTAQVRIEAVDDHGDPVGGAVRLELPARGARTVAAHEFEAGEGAGPWRLKVTADQPIEVMSLLESPTGHLANLSTSTPAESADSLYRERISEPVVQAKCVNCHVQGGIAGATHLLFVRAPIPNYQNHNLETFRDFLDAVDDGASLILNKIQGVGHGGGVQVAAGTPEFADMERFLALLGEDVAAAPITPQNLFDTVRMAPTRKTLRRAALIFAGRIPTEEEYAAAERGPTALRATIRSLMTGPEFHEFLIRGANDRLLTNRDTGAPILNHESDVQFVDFINEAYRRKKSAFDSGEYHLFWEWQTNVDHGLRRAPLELIAHVVENDLPYTEILTADYIMANPWAAVAYGASTRFDNPDNVHEFKPSRLVAYFREGDGFEYETYPDIQVSRVVDPGPLSTDFPHAGILNTKVFLARYPTTATNRNRARSRWTYYHFLGLDIEKSASRTTDPVALADTNNPTMRNPACTVCHRIMDPVAGAFQNYGDEGRYKNQWGGLDSLDWFYKIAGGEERTVQAESWEDRETLSWPLLLTAGDHTLTVAFTNDLGGPSGHVHLDRLRVADARGGVVFSRELETMEPPVSPWGPCGAQRNDHFELWDSSHYCRLYIDIKVPSDGSYTVEVMVWGDHGQQYGQDGMDPFAKLAVAINAYQHRDTWYRDMRAPGFAGELAPNADNSVQWLARQIVADERFAEATVKFWWPAIMGSEVAEPPEDEDDADFDGLLLAANAQGAEVTRLATGFRRGFHRRRAYNLKDLLVEIVLSDWFRAETLLDTDPVSQIALRDAGARRLLTPEELARKTAAITGVEWGRENPISNAFRGQYSALTDRYRLLYGGIDSDGITERARDITSVMAGVAKRHAARVSCAVVMRDLFLVPNPDSRLLTGIDLDTTPGLEFADSFEIDAGSRDDRETLSLEGQLTAGPKTAMLTYLNDYWGGDTADRNVHLDRLDVRNSGGEVVASVELEELPEGDCKSPNGDNFALWCQASVEVPFEIPATDSYTIEIVAWADHGGDELPRLNFIVEDANGSSAGAVAIRNKIVELHERMLGVEVTSHAPDVEAAYQLFVDEITRTREMQDKQFNPWECDWAWDHNFFEGILDGAVVEYENSEDGWRWYNYDWDRLGDFLNGRDWSDHYYTAQAWTVVLAYLLMDYRYLYL